jgi:hypothetical protein
VFIYLIVVSLKAKNWTKEEQKQIEFEKHVFLGEHVIMGSLSVKN